MENPAFNTPRAKILCRVWKALRSQPEAQAVTLTLPVSPSTRRAIGRATGAGKQLTDTVPPIRIPPAFATNASRHLFAISDSKRIQRQSLVLTVSRDFARQVLGRFTSSDANAARQLIALSVPTEVARHLLRLSLSSDLEYIDAATRLLELSSSDRSASSDFVNSGETIRTVPITSVFSDAEVAAAAKLVDFFDCSIFARGGQVLGFSADDFFAAQSLLDRFPCRKGPASSSPDADDVVGAARQLRALFASDDPTRPLGPVFLAFPDAEEQLQLVALCDSDVAARHLLERSIR